MSIQSLTLAMCAVVLALAGSAALNASEFDKATYVTFTDTVAIPGAILTPGTYIFERVNTDNSLVRVMNRNRTHVYLTQFTHTVDRPASVASGVPTVTLGEAAKGSPEPVKAWFPPDSSSGQEFVYR